MTEMDRAGNFNHTLEWDSFFPPIMEPIGGVVVKAGVSPQKGQYGKTK